jgi:D-arabinose 1-dehydrogenase-like Zn-dependent alcohol dehydrogenase
MDGGYAEYVTLYSEAVARIPIEADPAEAAPLLCAGITVFSMYVFWWINKQLFDTVAHWQ